MDVSGSVLLHLSGNILHKPRATDGHLAAGARISVLNVRTRVGILLGIGLGSVAEMGLTSGQHYPTEK
jgi:hypothetical protein